MRKLYKILLIVLAILLALGSMAAGGAYWYHHNVDRSGWAIEDGVYHYKDFYGKYVSGWQDLETGRYYFFPGNCAMATGWQMIDGNIYYFSGDGTLDTGFWEIDGERYYFAPDGVLHTGWLDYDGHRFYMDEKGIMLTSWQEIDGKRYYFRENGVMLTGRVFLEEHHYRFLDNGSMYTGWDVLDENKLVYFLPEGHRAIEWQRIDDKLYYFGLDGVMKTGWITLGSNTYYLKGDGSAAIGPTEIDGDTYYFGPSGIHVILVNADNPVPDYYKMELKIIEDWHQVSTECYRALAQMLTDCKNAGIEYTFNSAYRTIAQQKEILEDRTEEHMEGGLPYAAAYAKARETVALPGTSEHHLGLAVDLLGDEAIAWLTEHCWEYGFIVRYQGDKAHITGIIDEPWHFRYVGTTVAMELKTSGLCLEEYLGAWQPETEPTVPEETTETE